jgi:DNA-binding Lrp family transcriptional regulator
VADAAARWRDADFPPRVRATRAIEERLGFSEPVVDFALDRLFEDVTVASLTAVIEDELGSLDALEGFHARRGRPEVYFRGVARAAIVSSDSTIGVAIAPLLFALCAKAHVTVKDRDDRLVAAFAETLAEERRELAELLDVERWSGDDADASRLHLAEADVVVAFGSDASLRAIRAQLKPGARFEPFGHRISAGYVARESLASEASAAACATNAARDAALYDGSGCLSLHALFVERGGALTPEAFARELGRALERAAVEFPPGAAAQNESAALAYRRRQAFAATQGTTIVHAGGFVVTLDPRADEPPPLVRRALPLYSVDGPGEALAFIERHRLPLEGFAACPAERADVLDVALRSGAARITRLGRLQAPPIAGNHGAKERILPFVQAVYRDG